MMNNCETKNCTLNYILKNIIITTIPDDYFESSCFSKLNGTCITYNTNEINNPMKWNRFIYLPITIQKQYIQTLNNKYEVDYWMLERMFCVSQNTIKYYLKHQLHLTVNEWCCRTSKKYFSFLTFIKGV